MTIPGIVKIATKTILVMSTRMKIRPTPVVYYKPL